jgi:hypothetical protein
VVEDRRDKRSERSVPGRTHLVRVTQGACTVWRPWCSSTPKLVTVSQSGLGARRTMVRSSVERGMVIMVVLSSGKLATVE